MEYFEIKNLNKYQPTYKDGRKLIWVKWYLDCLTDYKFNKLNSSQKWLFIGLSMLQVKEQGKVPNDIDWICQQLQYDRKHILNDINMLHNLEILVTKCDEMSQNVPLDKRREEKIREEEIYVDFEKSTLNKWNSFCQKYPSIKSINIISKTRRKKLKERFLEPEFKEFDKILTAIEEQHFLIHGNSQSKEHANWIISFDWLILNDTNYLKVLERKYKNERDETPEYLRSVIK